MALILTDFHVVILEAALARPIADDPGWLIKWNRAPLMPPPFRRDHNHAVCGLKVAVSSPGVDLTCKTVPATLNGMQQKWDLTPRARRHHHRRAVGR